jgi:diphthamide synthase (EF-2-diphthine--ammonia ligase)
VRETLLERQAAAAGVPLIKVRIPSPCPNEAYEAAMAGAMAQAKREKIAAVAFGDLFLEDVRRYREEKMAPTGIRPVFPIWGIETKGLAREMVAAGLRAHITCIDPKQLDAAFAGRTFDDTFLDDLPDGVDPCGEKGEFHSFAHAGPMFDAPIPVTPGEIVERDGFVFADLLPA